MKKEKIQRKDLLSLSAYLDLRQSMQKKAIFMRKKRSVLLGDHIHLIFENEYLMRYQIQEILRIEGIKDEKLIQDELDIYNFLVPDNLTFKVTMKMEYSDKKIRDIALSQLLGIESHIFIKIADQLIYPFANEDLSFQNKETKTLSVHFLSFHITESIKKILIKTRKMEIGCTHKKYLCEPVLLSDDTITSLIEDL